MPPPYQEDAEERSVTRKEGPEYRPQIDIEFADAYYLINRMASEVANGPVIPRPLRGEFRVPFVRNFKVATSTASFGGTVFTLTWEDPEDEQFIAYYNIYVKDALSGNESPTFMGSAGSSPCVTRVIATAASSVTFFIQTVLQNGQTLPLERCPTCTGLVVDPTISGSTIPDFSLGLNKLATQAQGTLISFNASSQAYALAPGTSGRFLRTNGAGSLLTWETLNRVRVLPIAQRPVTVSGGVAWTTYGNILCTELPGGADSAISVWFQVPPEVVATGSLVLVLKFRPSAAPGGTNNKVKLNCAATVNNTLLGTTNDTVTVANSTNWDTYTAVSNIIATGNYAAGDLIQLTLTRDTTVANNMTQDFAIALVSITYTAAA